MKFPILLLSLAFFSCNNLESQTIKELTNKQQEYWYDGTAELTRYELQQSRYGENRKGDAIMIFVTEDFRTDKQVKYEGGDRKNVAPILKMNFTRNFVTGIYPYSLMSSIFSPVDGGPPYKATSTSQEWCGQLFTQFNLKKNKYQIQSNSYFQRENDQTYSIKNAQLEDGVWAQIRLYPTDLPEGEITIIPSQQYLMLNHAETKPYAAKAKLSNLKDGMSSYEIQYSNLDRKLTILFSTDFPHTIESWEESYVRKGQTYTTKGKKTHQIKEAYWGKNSVSDEGLRTKLGLE